MDASEKTGRVAGWLLRLAMKLPGARGALRRLLSRDGDRLLRDQLSHYGHDALKSVAVDGDPALFARIVGARGGEPLATLLFGNDSALLRHVIRLRGADALIPTLADLRASDRGALARALLNSGAPGALELLSRMPEFREKILASPRLAGMFSLMAIWELLRPHLPADDSALEERVSESLRSIADADQVRGCMLDAITEGDRVRLAHGTLRFPCRHSLWTLMHEILVNEDYFFSCESESPRIIDGGAHMGMAIYYFKSRFPGARIAAFEPHPGLREIAIENVARNGWEGVEVLPFALAGSRGNATFHISETWSMAGSLSERRASLGDTIREISVACVPLSDYLREPVDFLKLDIEGAEDEVLEEAAPWLHNVSNLFCEFHQGVGLASGRLAPILALLDRAGFEVQVGKSHNFQETSRCRPLTHFDGAASAILWARNRGQSRD